MLPTQLILVAVPISVWFILGRFVWPRAKVLIKAYFGAKGAIDLTQGSVISAIFGLICLLFLDTVSSRLTDMFNDIQSVNKPFQHDGDLISKLSAGKFRAFTQSKLIFSRFKKAMKKVEGSHVCNPVEIQYWTTAIRL